MLHAELRAAMRMPALITAEPEASVSFRTAPHGGVVTLRTPRSRACAM
jgi:hypothetical protein